MHAVWLCVIFLKIVYFYNEQCWSYFCMYKKTITFFSLSSACRLFLLSWISIRIAVNWSCTSVTWPHCVRNETQSFCRTLRRPPPITALTPPPGIRSCTAWRRNRWVFEHLHTCFCSWIIVVRLVLLPTSKGCLRELVWLVTVRVWIWHSAVMVNST